MTARSVHWHEGMFLRPHHFQAAQRHAQFLDHLNEKWDQHYNWGLRSIDLDLDALANYRLVVRSIEARLPDGTLVAEDGGLPVLDLKTAFEGGNSVTVYLAVPVANLGKANVGGNGTAESARFLLEAKALEDENTGVNPQEIQFRLLNLKFLLSSQDHAGYEVLPVARVQKSNRADGAPELDTTYIPPVLACDAWRPLAYDILEELYDRIGKFIHDLMEQVVPGNVTFDSHGQGDQRTLSLLRVLNEAFTGLHILGFAQGVHPLQAYLELCRVVGQLAVFSEKPEKRRTPEDLPKYDHDDLGRCFYWVKRYIIDILTQRQQPYIERFFMGAGKRMQVALENPSWLESVYQMFIGVKTTLNTEDCVKILTQGTLDMKIGSSDRADYIFERGMKGLEFKYAPLPPRVLPATQGLIYFQVNRDSQKEEWDHVRKSLSLAVRVNANRIAGNIEREKVLTVNLNNGTTRLQFILYLVPQDPKGAPK